MAACIESLPTEILEKIGKFVNLRLEFRAACFHNKNLRCALDEILGDERGGEFLHSNNIVIRDGFHCNMEDGGHVIKYHLSLRHLSTKKSNFEQIFHKWHVDLLQCGHPGTPEKKKFRSVTHLCDIEDVEQCLEDMLNKETRSNQSVFTIRGKGKAAESINKTLRVEGGDVAGAAGQNSGGRGRDRSAGSGVTGNAEHVPSVKMFSDIYSDIDSETESEFDSDCSCEWSEDDKNMNLNLNTPTSALDRAAGGIESWSAKRWMQSLEPKRSSQDQLPQTDSRERDRVLCLLQFPKSAKHRALLAGGEVGHDCLVGVGDPCDQETDISHKSENFHVKWDRKIAKIRSRFLDFLEQTRGGSVLAMFVRNDEEDRIRDCIPDLGHATGKAARFLYVECNKKAVLLTVKVAVQDQRYGYYCPPARSFEKTMLKPY